MAELATTMPRTVLPSAKVPWPELCIFGPTVKIAREGLGCLQIPYNDSAELRPNCGCQYIE